MDFGNKLADYLRQGADTLTNLPTEAQRFLTNPQAFTQLVTGKNPLPQETGFVAGATGLPAKNPIQGGVLNPASAPYQEGYEQGEPVAIASMALPAYASALRAGAPKAYNALENYMVKSGGILPMEAWHGTPHKIEGAFDIKKAGTGEGHAAYGHGMYFAENPAVAKGYQRALSDNEIKLNDKPLEESIGTYKSPAINEFLDYADNNGISNARDLLDIYIKSPTEKRFFGVPAIDNATAKELEEVKKVFDQVTIENLGKLYKVDIPDKDIPMMLDYDKPIKDQPHLYELVRSNITDPDILKTFERNAESGISGANVYENYLGGKTKAEKSANALKIGIKGIRYLDEGSRSAGKGTSNFVVFDPSDVKILEENGIPTRKELIQQQIDKIE
jgi:hypothetical protein